MSETVFLNAAFGGVQVFKGVNNLVGCAKSGKVLKYIFETKNIDWEKDNIYYQSSMEFASENGFETDEGAIEIVNDFLKIKYENALDNA